MHSVCSPSSSTLFYLVSLVSLSRVRFRYNKSVVTSRMGALLSSYRRGSHFAFDSLAWLLGSRTAAALRLVDPKFSSPSSSRRLYASSASPTTDANQRLEEELLCPCYYTENFFIKKVMR